MTIAACDAVYENGVFRPLSESPQLPEGQHVRLIVESERETVLVLAAQVYLGLSEEQVNEIEKISLTRGPFFDPAVT